MKSVKHKGLALLAVSSSVLGLGVGMAGTASALVWLDSVPGPSVDLNVQGTVKGTGASAVLSVAIDNAGSTGYVNTTDFGDGSKPATTTTATHAYAAGALKQTLTEKAEDTGHGLSSTTQVGVDATDPAHIVYTRSVPINLAAQGAVVTSQGTSSLDLSKVLPATADLGSLSGTCDQNGVLALSIDPKTKLAVCGWTGIAASATHVITLTYTDKTTGLTSTSQEQVVVPYQPVATFRAAVLAKGLVQLDVTGSMMNNPGAGTIDWGDGSTTSVSLPLHNNEIQTHQYTRLDGRPETPITFSVTDRFGEHASSTVQVDIMAPMVDFGQLTRFAGATRYGTGVAASRAAFPFAGTAAAVVLARGDVYADALAGIPLAKEKNGPLLLTPGGPSATTLDPNVAAEIKRVLPPANVGGTVYILGGTDAIPQRIQDYIKNTLGYNVERFAGADRYETALTIAQNPDALHNPGDIVVARGDDFADALAAGPFAAHVTPVMGGASTPNAIVLSTGNGVTEPVSLTPDTAKYVTSKFNVSHSVTSPTGVVAVGGGAVKAVSALTSDPKAFVAIAGTDRYDTAAKVAAAGWGTTPREVGVASGTNFPDSLTGGALMALEGYPLLLSDPNATSPALSAATGASLTAAKSSLMNTYLFGGTQVFGDEVAQNIMQLEGVSLGHYRVVTEPF